MNVVYSSSDSYSMVAGINVFPARKQPHLVTEELIFS